MFKTMGLLKRFNKLPEKFRNIVFFSEGPNYWNTMVPVVESLLEKGVAFSYLSMQDDDPGLHIDSELCEGFCIGDGSGFFYFMSMLQANVVLMTTPGLQTLSLKRSKGVSHYIHLVHAPVGMALYRKNSFDFFDTVMCSGSHQIDDLRKLEAKRKTKSKVLLKTGCPYMDVLKQKVESSETRQRMPSEPYTVLVAPTWGTNGALGRYGMKLVEPLIQANFDIIIRPHPQQMRSEQKLLSELKQVTKKSQAIKWDENPSGHQSMAAADILISDCSGIRFDFAFIYEKPVITLDFNLVSENLELEDLGEPVWEKEISRKLGLVVSDIDLDSLPQKIHGLLAREGLKDNLRRLRKDSLFNYGNSGPIAANQIISIAEMSKR